jgi:hypothetical protein
MGISPKSIERMEYRLEKVELGGAVYVVPEVVLLVDR